MNKMVKLFHPHVQQHERRRHFRTFCLASGFGIVSATLAAGFIYWVYDSNRFWR